MTEIKTYADIIKMANAMQMEREIKAELMQEQAYNIDPVRFEQSFREIFEEDGDEPEPKHKTLSDIHADHGVSIHGF